MRLLLYWMQTDQVQITDRGQRIYLQQVAVQILLALINLLILPYHKNYKVEKQIPTEQKLISRTVFICFKHFNSNKSEKISKFLIFLIVKAFKH